MPKLLENQIMSESEHYDFIVIGGGSAGYAAARSAVEKGLSTAVIDGAETLGGLCILRGCMPSKTLIESADRYRSIRHASQFGLRSTEHSALPAEIIARKRRLIGEFAEYRQGQLEDGRFTLIRGRASFSSANTVTVEPLDANDAAFEVEFRSACIATGSVISEPDFQGLKETGYLTSDDVLDLESPPASVVVLGGGAIALEMACYFEGIGKTVSVIQRSDHVLSGTDHDVADALTEAMCARGMTIFTGTSLKSFEKNPAGKKVVHFEHNGTPISVEADEILLALGRHPNTGGLALDAAGIQLSPSGRHIAANAEMATSVPHIFVAGDVCGPHEVVHIAIEQGENAAHNAAVFLGKPGTPKSIDYRLKLYGIFTHPHVATVGLGEDEARSHGRAVEVACYPFDDHGKSMVRGETAGFVKMIADAHSGELLGAAAVGPEATELIHELVVALYFHATAKQFISIPHYHPTLSEIWTYPAEDIAEAVDGRATA